MTNPIGSATEVASPLFYDIAQRQRLDKVLRQLPEADNRTGLPPAELVEPVKRINEVMRRYGVEFQFGGEPPRVITRIVDMESGETIRQIPSEEVLRVAERLNDIVGRLLESEA